MNQTLDGGTSGEVAHVDVESSRIIEQWVLGDQEAFSELAEWWEHLAGSLHDVGLPAVEEVVDVNEIKSISKRISTLGEECHQIR